MKMRLNKYLAFCGVGSRRKCDALIQDGEVKVNGEIASLGQVIDPKKDRVEYQGKPLVEETRGYYLFYKPIHVLTTLHDPFDRPTLADFLKEEDLRLFPVGRLDFDSEGLLFLTNDGSLAHQIQHPKYKMAKVYHVWVDRPVLAKDINTFQSGISLQEGITGEAKLRHLDRLQYEVILKQGWQRQIRRMFEVLGYGVTRLKRIQIGPFQLGDLRVGELRKIEWNAKNRL